MFSLRTNVVCWRPRSLRFVTFIVACLVLCATSGAAVWSHPELLRVEQVTFTGHSRAESSALRHLSNIRNGEYVWSVDLDEAVHGVQRHPWVRSAIARREFPNKVVISVTEYEPLALVMTDHLVYVDGNGEPFLNATSTDLDFPIITGVDAGVVSAHPDLPRAVVREGVSLLSSLEERHLLYREQISEVAFDSAMGWTVFVEGGPRFLFGLENIPGQLRRLSHVLQNGVTLRDGVIVDLAPESVAIVRPLRPGR